MQPVIEVQNIARHFRVGSELKSFTDHRFKHQQK